MVSTEVCKMDWILIWLCGSIYHISITFQVSWKLYCNSPMFCLSAFTLISGSKFLQPYGPRQHGIKLSPCYPECLICASEQLICILSGLHMSPAYISPGHLGVFLECISVLRYVMHDIQESMVHFCYNSIRT